ncbi:MAG: hypothetical protein K2Q28_02525 [Hyphomicrobium sp.]|nr:hypothetical protein [Hyphomicrobium sp.]
MGRRADTEKEDDEDREAVWLDFELALSRCGPVDPVDVRAALLDLGLTVVRIEDAQTGATMLRDVLNRKPLFRITFVADVTDPTAPAIAIDFAQSQIEAEARALTLLPIYRGRGAKGWRITKVSM